ncbi:helix-turn-helix domain-containing protein [Saccharothrix texasensis]|uniref:Regulatory LuxR family protein n=1 Tax=Saccharothrix texasensis TaxID=103734 RepID=A0A3N1H039_9PSEU|nr:helix-turn-helix transcriptional regulator [Saccharothrix texasensis]ROP35911.1 regulatory LuxR family protein [Saccharothrix texasensis]
MEHDVDRSAGTGRRVPAEWRLPDGLGLDGLSLERVRRTRAELVERGRWGEADQVVREVIDLLAAGPAGVRGPQLGGLVYVPGGPSPDDSQCAKGDVAGVPEEQRLAARAVQLANRGVDRAGAVATARQLLALPGGRETGAFWCGVLVLAHADELDTAMDLSVRAMRSPDVIDFGEARGVVALLVARLMWLGGDPGGAAKVLGGSLRRDVCRQIRSVAVAWLVSALVDLGELSRAHDLLLEHGFSGTLAGVQDRAELFMARGALRFALGQYDRALEDFLDCGRDLTAWGVTNPAVAPWRSRAAVCANAVGRTDLAQALVSKEMAAARRWGSRRSVGLASHAAALVAGGEPASLREVVAVLDGTDAVGDSLHARYDLALALGTRELRGEARKALEAVRDTARRRGYAMWSGRAEEVLARMTALDRAGGLTRQERKIGELARTGRSNRQIAEEQYLTVRTVEFHLSRVYRKLGLTGRRDLKAILTPLS